MAKQTINIGTTANDRTGDPLRTAFTKTNSNFTELYANVATLNSSVVTDVSDLTDNEGLLFSGDYTDLSNTPFIASDVSDLTDTEGLFFSRDYGDLSNTPFIASDVSDLTDNENLLTIKDHIELTGIYQTSNNIISFTKAPNTDSNTVFDTISEYVILTRDASGIGGQGGGIYNKAYEADYDVSISPILTLWNADGWDDVSDIETRYYQTFRQALRNSVGANIVGAELIMKDTASNEYYKIKFSQWAQGASHDGSFAYTREKIDTTIPIGITFYDGSTLPKAPNTKPKFEQSYVGDFGGYGLTISQAGRQVYIYDNIVEIPSYNEHNFKIGDIIQIVTGGFASTIRSKVNNDIELPDATLYIQGETNSVASFDIPARSMAFLSKINQNDWQLSISEPFFNAVGESIFPTLTVPISDNVNPNGTGQILKFGDSTQQAIIYGPESTSSSNNAERIIIQGAPGYANTSGEGGDIYLWAGPGGSESGNGGDIKIRAGLGNGSGNGGYLNLQAGDSFNGAGFGGYINIESGESSESGNGGDITVQARSGGEITLRTIAGDWLFGSDGNLTLPAGGTIAEDVSVSGAIKLTPAGGANAYQALLIYPTAGAGDGDHIHLTAAGGTTELYLGSDNHYVKLASGGIVRIQADDGAANSASWTFGADGNLTLPVGSIISETASSPGLLRTKYSGNFVLDPTWFTTNAGNLIESTTLTSTIQDADEVDVALSFEYVGYFVPPTSANYTFSAHADETFIFWIGDKALSDYTFANKDMYGNYNGTNPEQQIQSFNINLTAGKFYPIRIQWANGGGYGALDVFTWANDAGQANTTNFSGHIYTANSGTAIVSVHDNKSIILSTNTGNNWSFRPDGSLIFPNSTSISDDIEGTGHFGLTTAANTGFTVITNAGDHQWAFGVDGNLTLPAGGTIAEGVVTNNPTIELVPPRPDVASQKLVVKGGGAYNVNTNGINLNYYQNTAIVGDTLTFYVNSETYANQTLYWWIHPSGAGISDPGFGTVTLANGSAGTFTFTVDNDDYEFTVRVSPTNNYDPATVGVESLLINAAAPTFSEYHLHLTTGDLAETSIFLGTDNHNARTTINGNIQITTPNEINNIWDFDTDGTLTLPAVVWNYEPVTYTSIPVTYGATELTFTVLPNNTIVNMRVAVGAGGYGANSFNLTVPGTTFPGGTSPTNDIVFDVQTFESAGPVYSTDPTSEVYYVSGTPPQRYDNIYSTGSVGIGAGANTQHWVFGENGTTSFPNSAIQTNGELTIQILSTVPTSISNINSQGGWNTGSYTGLATVGGSGTGLTVDASTPGNGYLDTITIATPGSGYANGETITVLGEGLGATFTVVITDKLWTFEEDGVLTFPDATVQVTAWTGGIPPTSSKGAIGDKVGMIAADSGYLYVCTADYTNGTPDIWSRTAITASTW